MKKESKIYSDQLQLEVAKAIVENNYSWKEAQAKYGIKSQGSIGRWVERYKKGRLIASTPMKAPDKLDYEALLKQVQHLRKQLHQQEIQVYALDKIIDLTEKDLQMDIRKKYGTGQPK